jgi:hypothetical protein
LLRLHYWPSPESPWWSEIAQPGPLDITGEINVARFRIVVPAIWNGTFIEFVRGHVDKADHPGEIDHRNPTLPPNAALLLAEGYALAGSARKANGWSVDEGLDDVVGPKTTGVRSLIENMVRPSTTRTCDLLVRRLMQVFGLVGSSLV